MPVTAKFWCFWPLFHDESDWNFRWMWPLTLQCHMSKTVAYNLSLVMLQAKNIMFVHKSMIADKWRATDTQQQQWQARQVDRVCSFCCRSCCRVSVARCLSAIMLLCTNMMFLACSMTKDGPEGAIFGMEHWKVGGHIHKKFQPLSWRKSGQKHQNSAVTGTVLLSTHHT